jgi:integrase
VGIETSIPIKKVGIVKKRVLRKGSSTDFIQGRKPSMLTDTRIRAAKPKGAPYKLTDAKGLYLEIKPTGSKLWRYRYRIEGKENVFAAGEYCHEPNGETAEDKSARIEGGRLTLAEARACRDTWRGMVKRGTHPARERKQEKARQVAKTRNTFEAVYEEWLVTRNWAPTTKLNRVSQIKYHVLPYLGHLPINEISAQMVLDVLRKAAEEIPITRQQGRGARQLTVGSAAVAQKLRQYISGVFAVGIATERAETNPAGSLRVVMTPARATVHKTPLTTAQTGALMRALDAYRGDPKTVLSYQLMWWTLLRPGETVSADWSEFDLESGIWTIPRGRMKIKKAAMGDHRVPLPQQAIEALKRWHAFTGGVGLVFPHRDSRTKPMPAGSLGKAFGNFKLDFEYSPHATRTTASTRLNEMKFREDVIERALDHEGRDAVRRAYNRADYFDERKEMLQQWADMLDAWRTGAKVIPLNTAA